MRHIAASYSDLSWVLILLPILILCKFFVSPLFQPVQTLGNAQKSLADRANLDRRVPVHWIFHLGRDLRYPHIHGTPYVGALPVRFMLHFYWLRSLMRRDAVPCRCAVPLDCSLDAQTPFAVPTYDLTHETAPPQPYYTNPPDVSGKP